MAENKKNENEVNWEDENSKWNDNFEISSNNEILKDSYSNEELQTEFNFDNNENNNNQNHVNYEIKKIKEELSKLTEFEIFRIQTFGMTAFSIVNGFIVGGFVGLIHGAVLGYKTRKLIGGGVGGVVSRTLKEGFKIGMDTSIAMGAYTSTRMCARYIRKKDDPINSMFGGFVAGVATPIISRNRVNMFRRAWQLSSTFGLMHLITGIGGLDFLLDVELGKMRDM